MKKSYVLCTFPQIESSSQEDVCALMFVAALLQQPEGGSTPSARGQRRGEPTCAVVEGPWFSLEKESSVTGCNTGEP